MLTVKHTDRRLWEAGMILRQFLHTDPVAISHLFGCGGRAVSRSPDKSTPEDVLRYQLWLASIGTTVPTVNGASTDPVADPGLISATG